MSVLPACMDVHPTSGWEPPRVCWELNLGFLQEQQAVLTAKPYNELQP